MYVKIHEGRELKGVKGRRRITDSIPNNSVLGGEREIPRENNTHEY